MHSEKPPVRTRTDGTHDTGRQAVETASRDAAIPMFDSQALLQGQGSVAIRHHGVVYRLQATKLGKLILTK